MRGLERGHVRQIVQLNKLGNTLKWVFVNVLMLNWSSNKLQYDIKEVVMQNFDIPGKMLTNIRNSDSIVDYGATLGFFVLYKR